MLGDWLTGLDFSNRMALVSISLGIVLTLGVFLIARRMAGSAEAPRTSESSAANADEESVRDPFVYGCPSDKRIGLRRRGTTTAVMISDAAHEATPWHGIVADRSVGGLRLIQENAVAAGTTLSVRPGRATPTTPWTQIEVRHCRKTTDGWELGCSFIRTPASTLMMDFG